MDNNQINIFDFERLSYILQLINTNSEEEQYKAISYMAQHYPYNLLSEVCNAEQGIIRLNVELLKYLVNFQNIPENMQNLYICYIFLSKQINFLSNQDDITDDYEYMLMLLKVFLDLIKKLYTLTEITVKCDKVMEVIEIIVQSNFMKQKDIMKTTCEIFIRSHSYKHFSVQNVQDYIRSCTNLMLKVQDEHDTALEIVKTVIKAHKEFGTPEIQSYYVIVETTIKMINDDSEENFLENIFMCLDIMCLYCDKDGIIMKKVIEELLLKFDYICKFLRYDSYKNYCKNILETILETVFSDVYDSNFVTSQIELLSGYVNWDIIDFDLIFVIHYVELLHLKHLETHLMKKIQEKLCLENKIENLMVLKSIFLLYTIYIDYKQINYIAEEKLVNSIILNRIFLPKLVTYHVSQLTWALEKCTHNLKYTILKLWIENHENDNDIITVITNTNTHNLLLNLLLQNLEANTKQRTLNLLSKMKDKFRHTLHEQIFRFGFKCPNQLHIIFHLNPSTCVDDEIAKVISELFTGLLPNLSNIEAIKGCCGYSSKMLSKSKNLDVVKPFTSFSFLKFLYKLCTNKNDEELAKRGIRLLWTIFRIYAQFKELVQPLEEEFDDFLQGSASRINSALILIQTILKCKHSNPLIKIKKPSLNLHQKLLTLRNGEYSVYIYRILSLLIETQKVLAASLKNVFFINHEVTRNNCRPEFLIFLSTYISTLKNSEYVNLRKRDIFNLLKAKKNEAEVRDITKLLQQLHIKPKSLLE